MSEFNVLDYAPIGIMFLVAAGFGASQLLVTQLIGPRKRTATKLMPYECGKDPIGSARDRFSIKFYSVAVIFLLFDIEVLFMIPFAAAFKSLLNEEKLSGIAYGRIAFVEILVFIATLVVGIHVRLEKRYVRLGSSGSCRGSRQEAKDLGSTPPRIRRVSAKIAALGPKLWV